MKPQRMLLSLAAVLMGTAVAQADLIPVTDDIGDGVTPTSVTWYATNSYRLDTVIYVQNNAVLTIEPGTVIYGATNVSSSPVGIPELVSALWVTRGGKLYATGTVDKPIIFTAEGDDLAGKYGPTDTALWGGVVIMGRARINSAKYLPGQAATPKYDRYEGVTDNGPNGEHLFGGNDDADDSGALRYVSIRHCGRIFATDAELNCLTMGAVGSGTTLEYVEVYAGSDDGFEWWGGTVNSKHLVAAFIEDDDFDTDQGYRGTNQFWYGQKLRGGNVTSGGRGFENDGSVVSPADTPLTQWTTYNATLVGRGKDITDVAKGGAWFIEDGSSHRVFNSVIADYDLGMEIKDGQTVTYANASVMNNIFDVNSNANSLGEFYFTNAFNNTVESAGLGTISYTNNATLNPRPQAGSAAFEDVLAGAPEPVGYRGAFSGAGDAWADGWTALSSLGYLAPAMPVLGIEPVGADVVISWQSLAGATYQLQSASPVTGTFTDVGSAISGTSGVITVTNAAGLQQQYFRLLQTH